MEKKTMPSDTLGTITKILVIIKLVITILQLLK